MDFSAIFREHDEKRERLARIQAQSESDEAQRRALNARHLRGVLDSIVRPVVQEAMEEMMKNGVNARVEAVSTAERSEGESLGIQLVHRSDAGARISIARIIYAGNPSTMAVTMEMTGAGDLSSLNARLIVTVDQCTKEAVSEQVAGFIRGVLGVV